ncbi:hypothetical protein EMMF5_002909 [Cystobasidiomycetes sp. EMM_F5]
MLYNAAVITLAALSVVNASPLQARQATVTSAPVVPTGAVSSLTAAISSAASAASSVAANVTSRASSAVAPNATVTGNATSTSGVLIPSATGVTGNQSYPAYPCPVGYLLTYTQANVTLPLAVSRVSAAFGNWSTSRFFPNVTNATGGSAVGASHNINLMGLSINERLVNTTRNTTTGYASFIWNSTNGPYNAGVVSINNYQTVLQWSDTGVNTNGTANNRTLVNLFTNFCASNQDTGRVLVSTLAQLELANLQAALTTNTTNTTSVTSSLVAPTSAIAGATNTSRLSSVAASVTSRAANATNATSSAVAAITSALVSATSAALPSVPVSMSM